jgi:hypothetical protein
MVIPCSLGPKFSKQELAFDLNEMLFWGGREIV